MDEELRAAVRDVTERRAIEEVFLGYCEHVDLYEIDALVGLFTEDATLDFGHGRLFEGREQFRAVLRDRMALYENTSHHVSNIRVRLTGPDTATASVYVYAWHRRPGSRPDGSDDMHVWGRYYDDLVRTADGWRISYHRIRAAGEAGFAAPFERIARRPVRREGS